MNFASFGAASRAASAIILITTVGVPAAAGAAMAGHVYAIAAQNGSGETGTFALKPKGAKTTIEIHLLGAPDGIAQPAHLHLGTCDKLNPAPLIPLTSVTDGISETTVNMSMSALLAKGLALNIHKSGKEIATYVACGNLTK